MYDFQRIMGIAISSMKWACLFVNIDSSNDLCRQETSYYMNQCWPSSMRPSGATNVRVFLLDEDFISNLSCRIMTFVFQYPRFSKIEHKLNSIWPSNVI